MSEQQRRTRAVNLVVDPDAVPIDFLALLPPLSFYLATMTVHPRPLWERVARRVSGETGEGYLSAPKLPIEFADRYPSSGASRHLLPQGACCVIGS
ncbi:hypothetical protein ACVWZR_004007 [Bradyrhizobium sp. i1.3.1]